MKRYVLTETNYRLLRTLPLFKENYTIDFNDKEYSISVSSINELMYDVDDLIVMKGMDADQEQCNEFGKRLYNLYDELLVVDEIL